MRGLFIFCATALCVFAVDGLVCAATVTGPSARVLISLSTTTGPVTRQLSLRPLFRPNRSGDRFRQQRSVDGSIVIAEPNPAVDYAIRKVLPDPRVNHCIAIVDPRRK